MAGPPRVARRLVALTIAANSVLAVCGVVLLVTNLGNDGFLAVCGGVMSAAGALSLVLNLRDLRRM